MSEQKLNRCENCTLWESHRDEMSPEEIAKLNLPREKGNCAKWLCNNGTCLYFTITTKAKNDKEHLCDTCLNVYPECEPSMIEFGNGIGKDNIIECDAYQSKPIVEISSPIRLDAKELVDKVYGINVPLRHDRLIKHIVEVFTEAINEDFKLLEEKIEELSALLEDHERSDGHGL